MPTPRESPRGLTRRAALASALAAGTLAAGCTPQEVVTPSRLPRPTPSAGLDPDVVLAADALKQEQAMLDALAATVRAHHGLRAQLADAVSTHERHVRLLTRAVPEEARPSRTPSQTPSETPGASTSAGASGPARQSGSPSTHRGSGSPGPADEVPRDPRQAVRRLARDEDGLSLDNKRASFAAGSGAFARLLASMAAAAAQQAVVLGAGPGGGGW